MHDQQVDIAAAHFFSGDDFAGYKSTVFLHLYLVAFVHLVLIYGYRCFILCTPSGRAVSTSVNKTPVVGSRPAAFKPRAGWAQRSPAREGSGSPPKEAPDPRRRAPTAPRRGRWLRAVGERIQSETCRVQQRPLENSQGSKPNRKNSTERMGWGGRQPPRRVLALPPKLQNPVLLSQKVSFSSKSSRITPPDHHKIFLRRLLLTQPILTHAKTKVQKPGLSSQWQ